MYDALMYRTNMPHLSKSSLDIKTEKEILKALEIILARITKAEEMKFFLLSLLTPTERLMLAKRLMVTVLLKENVPDQEIANMLHVTRSTVYKFKLLLESRGQGYNIAFKVLDDEKLKEEIKESLIKFTKYSIRAAGGQIKVKNILR